MTNAEYDATEGADDADNSAVLGDTQLQSTALEDNALAVNYHGWLTSLAEPHLGAHPIELGSGLGGYVDTWIRHGVPRITATEADEGRLEVLRRRFSGEPRVEVRKIDLTDPPNERWSAFVSFNVLEHIPDDVAALRVARELVEPGGAVISFVPAFPFAMSRFDRAIGHVRRYTKDSLAAAYRSAGLEVAELRYVNAPGLLAWYLGMRVLGMTPKDGPIMRVWDGAVVPAARRLEARRSAPFGQSVFAVGIVSSGGHG